MKLSDSKSARWTALLIVSITMMFGYFFTDVMSPLEPLLTAAKDQKNPNQVNGQKSGNGAMVQKTATAPVTSKATVARNAVKVGVMLPLHNVDGDGKRMVEYYRGLLLACETLKQQGTDIDVRAWNVPIDADIRNTLLQEGANQCDIIFGPLYTKQVAPLTNFCKTYGIKMVIPFSISGDDVERNKEIFQVYQSDDALNDATIKAFLSRFTNVHPIFVDCNDSTSRKGNFTFGLRKELERRKINYSITNVNSSIEQFAKAFMPSKQNVIILNTGRSPQLTQVLNKLDEFDAKYPGAAISLFGYTEWLMYAKYNLERFYKYDTYIPSTFYYNPNSAQTKALESRYERWFHQPMMVAQPRFAITGFDHGMYLIQGVKRYGKNFTGERQQMTYQPVQTPLRFEKTSRGGYKNKSFQSCQEIRSRHLLMLRSKDIHHASKFRRKGNPPLPYRYHPALPVPSCHSSRLLPA
jgi:hypothetical protein